MNVVWHVDDDVDDYDDYDHHHWLKEKNIYIAIWWNDSFLLKLFWSIGRKTKYNNIVWREIKNIYICM